MKFPGSIGRDKWRHFWVGIPLGAALEYAALYLMPGYSKFIPSLVAGLILLIICYGFELFSKITGKGHYEMWDAIAGAIGGFLGLAIILILKGA